jgi:HAE1 family hydrophobic/amphiphilic exporter-1
MTSISSITGFMPLVVASGAGAASRQAIGLAVVGGMAAATIMSLLFTPVFYVVMQRLSEFRKKPAFSGGASRSGTSETAGG